MLKRYRLDTRNEVQYRNEVAAFAKFRNETTRNEGSDALIGFYGSFKHGDSWHLLLEYANGGTLSRLFQTDEKPDTGRDIKTFWFRLFELLRSLSMLHDVKVKNQQGGVVEHLKGHVFFNSIINS